MSWTIASSSEETPTCHWSSPTVGGTTIIIGLAFNYGMGLITYNSPRHSLEKMHLREQCLAATLHRREGAFTSLEGLAAQAGSVVTSIFSVE